MKNAVKTQKKFVTLTKLEIAERQLNEAIVLFFEERDSVSIHTLAGASLQIFLDHLSEDDVIDNSIFLDGRTIYIKDEHRKNFVDHINREKNFFKHADRDLKKGITTIEFNPEINVVYIFEAIRALSVVNKGKPYSPEVATFLGWFIAHNRELLRDEFKSEFAKLTPISLSGALMALRLLKEKKK